MTRKSPDHMEGELLRVNASTGEFTVVVNESIGALVLTMPVIELPDGQGLLWWSRRDGYGHYYLYDLEGSMKRQVTSGQFNAGEVLGIDKERRRIYFVAVGRERGRNPYYEHLYSVNFDGTELRLLTYEDAHHEISLSPSRECFVDNYSRVDTPPKTLLVDIDGRPLLELEAADISGLLSSGWRRPEILKAKAADDKTDLWGVMWKPYDFNADLKYPIISFVYPGPQDELIPLTFSDGLDNNAHLAQYGFIVIHFGSRGGSYKRSLEYSEHYRGDLRDYSLADTKAVIEDLAKRYPWIDIDRVGVWGGSSGAYAAVTSMLTYPDFYKVCVARSGPHDPSIYHGWWSDQFQGMKRTVSEDSTVRWLTEVAAGNLELAADLKGRLLLIHSEMDQNVHPAHSARMARALMAANKRFDYFVVPGAGHGWGPNWPYVQRMIWTYFVHHLMGDTRWDVDMFEDFNR
jgi:dipeptidyl aminopeptidase/acylaminoacyl peptidase